MIQKYIRLLSYEEACAVIDYVKLMHTEAYANITSGGLSLCCNVDELAEIEQYVQTIAIRYEISDEHPEATNKKIIEQFKNINEEL